MNPELSLDECFAWMKRYEDTSWNALALVTASNRDHSPLKVMGNLGLHVEILRNTLDRVADLRFDPECDCCRTVIERLQHEH